MSTDALEIARWQFTVAWGLAEEVHLPRLTDEMCLWCPQSASATVRQGADGRCWADWDGRHSLEPCPPSIAWLTWHVIWWWPGALAVLRGAQPAEPTHISWPGTARSSVLELRRIAEDWGVALDELSPDRAAVARPFPWPEPRPLIYLVAWVNLELMKNVAEVGEVANMFVNRRN